MKFRPCIDIHNGKVKQIVGGSLKDQGNQANENFVSEQDASYYAQLYKEKGITGGHVILLNKKIPNIIRKQSGRRCWHFLHIRADCRLAAVSTRKMPANF